jgi:diaminohydroxyphosphoribosylaminopyrimidine deaminase/5-amino-6-(5-phosphoribosylamino)uracil reductase
MHPADADVPERAVTERGDREAMERAREAASRARTRTAPNPWVGAVVVGADGTVLGTGATAPPGGPHAEVEALRAAGSSARGATVFVTLEPCAHEGRTPPCADALIDAGVSRVVAALEDPDPQVSGDGIARLRAAGVDVEVGLSADDVARDLAPYLHQRRTGRAFVVLKTAMSLDGRTAASDGSSRWITGADARADAHRLRAASQAIVVGAGTALADRPALTVRDADPMPPSQPLRVVLDAQGRVDASGPLFDTAIAPTLVVTTERAPAPAVDAWRAAGAKIEVVAPGARGVGVDLGATWELLARSYGVLQALVEGGARLHGSCIEQQCADQIVAYLAPTLLGTGGLPGIDFAGPASLDRAQRWHVLDATQVGDDVRVTLEPGAG